MSFFSGREITLYNQALDLAENQITNKSFSGIRDNNFTSVQDKTQVAQLNTVIIIGIKGFSQISDQLETLDQRLQILEGSIKANNNSLHTKLDRISGNLERTLITSSSSGIPQDQIKTILEKLNKLEETNSLINSLRINLDKTLSNTILLLRDAIVTRELIKSSVNEVINTIKGYLEQLTNYITEKINGTSSITPLTKNNNRNIIYTTPSFIIDIDGNIKKDE